MPKETGWVIVATEGTTVDGRSISKDWINQMAASYDPNEYQARIWPEHFRSSWGPFEGKAWGDVLELKAADQGGKLRLFAKLRANDYLLEANKDDQKLYMSIEPEPDYKASGICYLMGLAVTDSPASTGTTRLKFSMGSSTKEHDFSAFETLKPTDFIRSDDEHMPTEKGLFALLSNFFSSGHKPTAAEAEEEPMNEKQFDALMGKIDGIGEKVNTLETQVNEFSKKPADPKLEEKPEETTAGEGKPDTGITPEQFNTLVSKLDGIETQQTKLTNDFAALKKEVPNQEPDPAGGSDTISLV
ncbi:GPO family capsid scaffolding protein [Shewanella algae]|uniref:GPO family capsid scaffolding protein n=1 Tax=Shewanella algae TaxID=38313 RepID=UPI001AADDD0A|nr:GPO family capsid scaffolding protein [Shewanella algae]MBO2682998.1 GPO family capsid scaffolding protein [Shewanella algae]